jgi:hypothetical protein
MTLYHAPSTPSLNWEHPLIAAGNPTLVTVFDSLTPTNLVTQEQGSYAGSSLSVVAGLAGAGVRQPAISSTSNRIAVAANAGLIVPQSRMTACILRRKLDAVARSASVFGAYTSSTSLFTFFAPFVDGTTYFDFANGTAGSGRISISGQPYDTDLDAFILVAGPTKGREIWRRGNKIASNASAKATLSAPLAAPLYVGSHNGSVHSDVQEIYLLAIFDSEFSDQQCRDWFAAPMGLLASPEAEDDELWMVSASSIVLTAAPVDVAPESATAALTQAQALAAAAADVAAASGTGTLSQVQALTATPAEAAAEAGTGALDQASTLTAAAADTAPAAGTGALAQVQILAAASATADVSAGAHALAGTGLGPVISPRARRVTPLRAARSITPRRRAVRLQELAHG